MNAKRLLGWGLAYVGGSAMAYHFFKPASAPPTDEDRRRVWERFTHDYDEKTEKDEGANGILDARQELMGRAKGRVLEVGVGTGRNVQFYPSQCQLVGVDTSVSMLQVAKKKAAGAGLEDARFFVMDAHAINFPDGSFDTVVDTFGLCSYDRPESVVSEMLRVCKTDGRVLLLEHGRSTSLVGVLLNIYLDKKANKHAQSWGCWWNKPIHDIVMNTLENVGYQVPFASVTHTTKNFGTTHQFIIQVHRAAEKDEPREVST